MIALPLPGSRSAWVLNGTAGDPFVPDWASNHSQNDVFWDWHIDLQWGGLGVNVSILLDLQSALIFAGHQSFFHEKTLF